MTKNNSPALLTLVAIRTSLVFAMANFGRHGDYHTSIHYHSSYHDLDTQTSPPLHGPTSPSRPTTHARHTRLIEPSTQRTPPVQPLHYKLRPHYPDFHGDSFYSWANSKMPWWFTKQTPGYRSSRAAAVHESMLEDLRIETLRATKERAFRRLQSAQDRWERYDDQWRQAVGDELEWGLPDMPYWSRGRSGDMEGRSGVTVERRRGRLMMVKQTKKSAKKDNRRGGVKERFGFI